MSLAPGNQHFEDLCGGIARTGHLETANDSIGCGLVTESRSEKMVASQRSNADPMIANLVDRINGGLQLLGNVEWSTGVQTIARGVATFLREWDTQHRAVYWDNVALAHAPPRTFGNTC